MDNNEVDFKICLTLSAKCLRNADIFSKSDPMCVVYSSSGAQHEGVYKFSEVGRTETVMNCLNPEWSKKVILKYSSPAQEIRLEVFDIDCSSASLADHDFLGCAELSLQSLLQAPHGKRTLLLEDKKSKCGRCGEITIVAEKEPVDRCDYITFKLYAVNVDKKDIFGKSDPFLNIYKILGDQSRQLIYRTEVAKKTLSPSWHPFTISLRQMCTDDLNRKLVIECYDFDNDGGHDFIGSCETTLRRLLHRQDMELPLINEKKRQKKAYSYINSGRLIFSAVNLKHKYAFMEFINGGTQIQLAIAVDMTRSNGEFIKPSSLHYLSDEKLNGYQIAVRCIADICQRFSASNVYDCMGFGASIPITVCGRKIQHCFPLDFKTGSYEVSGINRVLDLYSNCVRSVIAEEPTRILPVIQRTVERVLTFPRDGSRYQILLIVTDGGINDWSNVANVIARSSKLPMSIVIIVIGKGRCDKQEIRKLKKPLSAGRCESKRCNIQLLYLRKFYKRSKHSSGKDVLLKETLAAKMLSKIREQLSTYMFVNSVKPKSIRTVRTRSCLSNNLKFPETTQNVGRRSVASNVDMPSCSRSVLLNCAHTSLGVVPARNCHSPVARITDCDRYENIQERYFMEIAASNEADRLMRSCCISQTANAHDTRSSLNQQNVSSNCAVSSTYFQYNTPEVAVGESSNMRNSVMNVLSANDPPPPYSSLFPNDL